MTSFTLPRQLEFIPMAKFEQAWLKLRTVSQISDWVDLLRMVNGQIEVGALNAKTEIPLRWTTSNPWPGPIQDWQ